MVTTGDSKLNAERELDKLVRLRGVTGVEDRESCIESRSLGASLRFRSYTFGISSRETVEVYLLGLRFILVTGVALGVEDGERNICYEAHVERSPNITFIGGVGKSSFSVNYFNISLAFFLLAVLAFFSSNKLIVVILGILEQK